MKNLFPVTSMTISVSCVILREKKIRGTGKDYDGQPDLFVTEVTTQKEIRNPYGRSVRLDIEAADSTGRRFNVEVQRSDRGAVPQRARYYSSMMDTRLLKTGQAY